MMPPRVRSTRCLAALAMLLAVMAHAALPLRAGAQSAQQQPRGWLDWRSLDTRHFTVHFPREAEPWARPVAERMDAIHDVVKAMVGHAPAERVQVIVDDPINGANGFAVPVLDRPLAVFWTTPPTPRQSIGHFRGWGELLAVHEYAHLAHLTIPSRNPRERLLMSLSPWRGSPLALRSPRWVIEGYATYIEGRVTAHGRPHNAWRAAILRQWALEGRLPTYGQLNGTDGYQAGAFAYLAGSAFLEHVARRDTASGSPDSSLAFLWRRMSARTKRNFDQAFAGLHGRAPADAYGRFVAELSSDAVAIERAIADSGGLVQGQLVQRLSWETGDPAVSHDGRFIATVLRSREAPSRVVVWRTDWRPPGSDSTPRRPRRSRARRVVRDSLDVPDRRFVPPPREVVEELRAPIGSSYESPRFLRGDSALLLHRLTPVGDGSLRHDLYVWGRGGVRRVTHGAGARDADPDPGSDSLAIAVRCRWGTCDVVRVNLLTGDVRTVLAGSPTRSFHRPRHLGASAIAVAVNEHGRWRIATAGRDGSGMRFIDPDDGVSRYEPSPVRGDTSVVVVSERGGIMNLEELPVDGGAPRTLTRVTGAALAPEVDRRDGSIWFLSMHSRGLDLRRLPPGDSTPPAPLVALDTSLAPLMPMPAAHAPVTLVASALGPHRKYATAPRDVRWLPGGTGGVDGYGARLVLTSSDVLGRLHLVATGAIGDPGTYRGASLAFTSRRWRPMVWGEAAFTSQWPTESRAAGWRRSPIATALVAEHRAAALGFEIGGDWQARALRLRAGAQSGELRQGSAAGAVPGMTPLPGLGPWQGRTLGAALLDGSLRQRGAGWSMTQRLILQAEAGTSGSDDFTRQLVSAGFAAAGRRVFPLAVSGTYGVLRRTNSAYERFVIGGVGAPLTDPLFLAQRHAQPLLPLGALDGTRLLAFRAATPVGPLTFVYSGASANDGGRFSRWQRTPALEVGFASPAIPMQSVPAVSAVAGVGRALDQEGRPIRGYFTVSLRP